MAEIVEDLFYEFKCLNLLWSYTVLILLAFGLPVPYLSRSLSLHLRNMIVAAAAADDDDDD